MALAALVLAAGCGGSGGGASSSAQLVRGDGYRVTLPEEWSLKRRGRALAARPPGGSSDAPAAISVTVFPLARPFDASQWEEAVRELDQRVAELAAREPSKVTMRETITVADERARSYELTRSGGVAERLVYVFRAKREYQLFCRLGGDATRNACEQLISSFSFEA